MRMPRSVAELLSSVPLELFVWLLLILPYVAARIARGDGARTLRFKLGLRLGTWRWYAVAVAIGLFSAALVVPFADSMRTLVSDPSYAQAFYAGWPLTLPTVLHAFVRELVYRALGEELFFRGLLAGVLFRHMNFPAANLLQAGFFLLPHILILPLAGWNYWPLMLPIFAIGMLIGWLRYKSGSVLPAVLAHTIANTCAAVFVMSVH